ncbi:MAG: flagellar hook-length control protein FliK [Ignavibacteriales bacterium]|nr:flagellar hook-length control protein FliK [Ignavibacteriales bacterium]
MNLNPLFFNKQPGNDSLKLLGLNQAASQTYLFSDIIKVCEEELDGGTNVKLKSSLTDIIPNLNNLELSAPAESKLTFVIEKVIDSLDVNGVEIKSDLFKLDKANITHSEIAFNSEELKTFLNELNSLLLDVPGITNIKTETVNKSSEKENIDKDDEKTDGEILSPDSILSILQNNDSIKLILKTEGEKLTFAFSKTEPETAADIKTDSELSVDSLPGSEKVNSGTEQNLIASSQQQKQNGISISGNQEKVDQTSARNEYYKIEIVHTELEEEKTSTDRAGKSPFLFNARSLKVINDFLAKYASDTKNAEGSIIQNILAGLNADNSFSSIAPGVETSGKTSNETAGANIITIKNSQSLNLQSGTPFEPIVNDDQEEQISILSNRQIQTFNENSDLKRKLVFINSPAKTEANSSAAQTKLASTNLVGNENELEQNSSAGTFAVKNNANQDEQSQKEVFIFNTQRSMKDLLNSSDPSAKNKINDTTRETISTTGVQKIDAKQSISTEQQNAEKTLQSKENILNNNVVYNASDSGNSQNQSKAKQNSSHEDTDNQSASSAQTINENVSKTDQPKEHQRNFVFEINSNTEHKIDRSAVNKTKSMDDLNSFNETLKVIKTDELAVEINKYLQSNEKQSITFQLTPENLGKVKLMVDYADSQLHASIEVENEQVKQFVQSNIEQLKNNLQSSGVQISNINVSISNEQRDQKNFAPKKRNLADADEIKVNEKKSSSETQKKMGYNTYEYLA